MNNVLLQVEALNSMIPITRFNRGEAGKIFDEVEKTGVKVAIKNNQPACILVPVDEYKEILETLKDYKLLLEAQSRLLNPKNQDLISEEEVMKELGISEEDLENIDVEIE